MPKTNCWEFQGCGRGPDGDRVEELGHCPAAIETRLDGVNGGTNGGRACWVVAGLLAAGGPQGSFVPETLCIHCSFHDRVLEEEGHGFVFTPSILSAVDRLDTRRYSTPSCLLENGADRKP